MCVRMCLRICFAFCFALPAGLGRLSGLLRSGRLLIAVQLESTVYEPLVGDFELRADHLPRLVEFIELHSGDSRQAAPIFWQRTDLPASAQEHEVHAALD